MKRFCLCSASSAVLLLAMGLVAAGWAQEEDLSVGRGLGVGVRFLPQALMPLMPSDADPALNTALVLRYWAKDSLGFEAGGWLSNFSDAWSSRSLTSLAGGVLFKLAENPQLDPYLAGRVISLQGFRKESYIVCKTPSAEPGSQALEDEPMPPCGPWASSESRTSTLAVAAVAGLEWSFAPQAALDFEVALIYAQTMTTTAPLPLPAEGEPIPLPAAETSGCVSLGIALSLTLSLYFSSR